MIEMTVEEFQKIVDGLGVNESAYDEWVIPAERTAAIVMSRYPQEDWTEYWWRNFRLAETKLVD